MFIGREKELDSLEMLYCSNRFEFAVIYGRRRVGKTALINEFVSGKEAIYFTGVETNEKQNLENLSKCIVDHMTNGAINTSFASFQDALEAVFKLAEKERLVFVIDEYPYVARASKSLASTLQLLIDEYKASSKLFLILCGSSMSYMEDHVLAYKAPLYGRRTAQFKVRPFEFREACQYLSGFTPTDKALAYGVIGGTPQYLLQFDNQCSIEENIKHIFLDPTSSVYEEPLNLLKQEVREPAIYNAIVTAIATGSSKLSEISSKVGEESSVCSRYINNLVTLEIIKKETPYGDDSKRKTIYSIEDNMFKFWYRFVPQNASVISRGAAELAYSRIEPQLQHYMGSVFEEICKQYLWAHLLEGKCAVPFKDIGRWWGINPKTRQQSEIDIIGTDDNDNILFGECKWSNEKVDLNVLERLIGKSNMFHYHNKFYYLFAKSGFTKGCIDKADEIGHVILVSYEEMLGDFI